METEAILKGGKVVFSEFRKLEKEIEISERTIQCIIVGYMIGQNGQRNETYHEIAESESYKILCNSLITDGETSKDTINSAIHELFEKQPDIAKLLEVE